MSIKDHRIEVDKIRILEFSLAFPHVLEGMRLPKSASARIRRLHFKPNTYVLSTTTNPKLVFIRMTPLQHQAIRLLASARLLEFENGNTQVIQKTSSPIPPKLKSTIEKKNIRDAELMTILAHELATLPLLGKNGLKDRTGLMEFRYDPI